MSSSAHRSVSPWLWVPTLYFAQGMPNGLLEDIAPAFFKDLGVANDDLTHALSLAALPWMLKALWSPVVDAYGTKRRWIGLGQLVCALAFAGFAATPFMGSPVAYGLVFLTLVALCSATHDIAADGFYLFAVPTEGEKSFFSGIRNTAFRLAKVFCGSSLVLCAGALIAAGRPAAFSWGVALGLSAVVMAALALWHIRVLPAPVEDRPAYGSGDLLGAFKEGWRTLFAKPGIGKLIFFILFFRLSEALLSALFAAFLKDPVSQGGLGLSPKDFGWVNTAGIVALLAGGVLGGVLTARFGLRKMLWPLVAVMHLPNLAFLALAYAQPTNFPLVTGAVLVEKFGYGFGMCAIMLYLIYVCTGERRVTHYAICSGFMLIGAKGFSYFSGDIQKALGYIGFFQVVLAAVIPGLVATWLIRDIDPAFGRK